VVQAASTADAAASEKLRRLKLGDEGFNEFSSNGTGDAGGVARAAIRLSSDQTDRWRRFRALGICSLHPGIDVRAGPYRSARTY
jgi:hypothetical protein